MTRLVQLKNGNTKRVALVDEPHLRVLKNVETVYELVGAAIAEAKDLSRIAQDLATGEFLDYDLVYSGRSDWRLLAPISHPADSAHCILTGTGLTHLGSAQGRDSMHSSGSGATTTRAVAAGAAAAPAEPITDSMKMFRWGIEGGRPAAGAIGVAPEWFYKGTGAALRAHGEALEIPAYAEDGGDEAEVAGIYVIGPDGVPRRIGLAAGNEFSDHVFEKRNYLNLAGSKLRTCALGPELVIDPKFDDVPVGVRIERDGETIWSKSFHTGEAAMCHSLQNIEHHHFKFEGHRRPGDVHVHFFGTAALSFGDGVRLQDSDMMEVAVGGFGRALRSPVRVARSAQSLVSVIPMK
jgi:hypothetical protein